MELELITNKQKNEQLTEYFTINSFLLFKIKCVSSSNFLFFDFTYNHTKINQLGSLEEARKEVKERFNNYISKIK